MTIEATPTECFVYTQSMEIKKVLENTGIHFMASMGRMNFFGKILFLHFII